MSLGAIDFGLIIDGAVVMVENIVRHLGLRQHELGRLLNTKERLHTVLSAAKEVGRPMFFGVLIITVVYVPILALTGIEGKMFKPMALTVIFALVGALILALTLMPVLCSYLLSAKIRRKTTSPFVSSSRLYEPSFASPCASAGFSSEARSPCLPWPCSSSAGSARSSSRSSTKARSQRT